MDWLGIGVFIIGLAFLVLVIVLIKPLLKLAGVLESTRQTTDQLPKLLDDGATQAYEVFQQVNTTLENVNEQINTVQPLFQIIGDVGESSRQYTSKWLNNSVEKESIAAGKEKKGFYEVAAFVLQLIQKKNEITHTSKQLKS